jgi:hypothetical protein
MSGIENLKKISLSKDSCPNLLFQFKVGWRNSFLMSEFVKKTSKKIPMEEIVIELMEFSLKQHPYG